MTDSFPYPEAYSNLQFCLLLFLQYNPPFQYLMLLMLHCCQFCLLLFVQYNPPFQYLMLLMLHCCQLMILELLMRSSFNSILIFWSNICNITHQSRILFNQVKMMEIEMLNYTLMLDINIGRDNVFIPLFILGWLLFSVLFYYSKNSLYYY